VADAAVDDLLAWLASGSDVDEHLADQLLPFLALARGVSRLTCPRVTPHLETVGWVVRQFLPVTITLGAGPPARIEVAPED
jgi:RNA 3'-terminal phosphate cyclase